MKNYEKIKTIGALPETYIHVPPTYFPAEISPPKTSAGAIVPESELIKSNESHI